MWQTWAPYFPRNKSQTLESFGCFWKMILKRASFNRKFSSYSFVAELTLLALNWKTLIVCSLQLKDLSDYQDFKHNIILDESTKKTAAPPPEMQNNCSRRDSGNVSSVEQIITPCPPQAHTHCVLTRRLCKMERTHGRESDTSQ